MSLNEAKLFRLLSTLFGSESVIWSMSLLTVCGGSLPELSVFELEGLGLPCDDFELVSLAEEARCQFTVVDFDDQPKLVLDLLDDPSAGIDLRRVEDRNLAKPMLAKLGVRHVVISQRDLSEILDPESSLDLVAYLGHYIADDQI